MSVMIVITYLMVGGQWRVEDATQSRPMQNLQCNDHVEPMHAKVDVFKTGWRKFEVRCEPQPNDF